MGRRLPDTLVLPDQARKDKSVAVLRVDYSGNPTNRNPEDILFASSGWKTGLWIGLPNAALGPYPVVARTTCNPCARSLVLPSALGTSGTSSQPGPVRGPS